MAVWFRTRGRVRPCPFCESALGVGATSCRRCGLPLTESSAPLPPAELVVNTHRQGSPASAAFLRLTQERKAIAIAIAVVLISLLGLSLTAHLRGPDFSGQDLVGASFSSPQRDLAGADFTRANLEYADLSSQDLFAADFASANLGSANFRGAEAIGASFRDANLTYARLADSQLTGADFTGADLTGADLTGADIAEANIASAYRCRTVMPDESIDSTNC